MHVWKVTVGACVDCMVDLGAAPELAAVVGFALVALAGAARALRRRGRRLRMNTNRPDVHPSTPDADGGPRED